MRDTAVIVSGLPRSGTSLAMQMLRAGGLPVWADAARPPDPDNPRGYYELARTRRLREDASWVCEARGRALKVVAELLPALPPGPAYRVVCMRRDLEDVLASQEAMLARRGAPAGGLPRARLAAILATKLAEARTWARRVGAAWLDVDYGGLVRDPRPRAEAIARFVGGGLDVDAMVAAVDPALCRQGRRGASAAV